MRINIILLFQLLFSVNLISQDLYKGEFSIDGYFIGTETKIPLGDHYGKDDDERIEIAVAYGKNASINRITVLEDADTICYKNFSNNFDDIEWIEIEEGLWIDKVEGDEVFAVNFDPTSEVKMHYAGFLETREPFDNSFIRNKPLIGKLKWFITGFAIGALNVMPNTIRIIKISPDLAYGAKGAANIPPNATIYYIIYNLENPRV